MRPRIWFLRRSFSGARNLRGTSVKQSLRPRGTFPCHPCPAWIKAPIQARSVDYGPEAKLRFVKLGVRTDLNIAGVVFCGCDIVCDIVPHSGEDDLKRMHGRPEQDVDPR